jgi:hypothetical protein
VRSVQELVAYAKANPGKVLADSTPQKLVAAAGAATVEAAFLAMTGGTRA